jgi:hypothetical protein
MNYSQQPSLGHQNELHTYLLTYGAEPFLRSRQLCSHSRTSQHFMEHGKNLTTKHRKGKKNDINGTDFCEYIVKQSISKHDFIS